MQFLGLRNWFAGEMFEALKRESLGCFRHNMDSFLRVCKTRMLIEIWTEKTWLIKVFCELAAALPTFWQIPWLPKPRKHFRSQDGKTVRAKG